MPELKHGMMVDGHLGGYVPGGDPDTSVPEVWQMLVEQQDVRTVIDVGAGDGQGAARWFAEHGCTVTAVDGLAPEHPVAGVQHVQLDYTDGPFAYVAGPDVDLVWSAEFVEHVEERFVPNFLATFRCGRIVAMTHAVPGQAGWHHVNCRDADYWIGVMAAIGYWCDWPLTGWVRDLAPPSSYVHKTGLVFRRHT